MADIYVNVNGIWKTVSNYYVNVNGVWKTGIGFAAKVAYNWIGVEEAELYTSGFPTYLELATLDFKEYMSAPAVLVGSKSGVTGGDTLDIPYWLCKPSWYLDSTLVYTPPSGGGSTPTNVLPVFNEIYNFDNYLEFTCNPKVYTSSKSGIDTSSFDIYEFMCKPAWYQLNTFVYTPPSSGTGGYVTGLGAYSTTSGGTQQYDGLAYQIGTEVTAYNIGSQDGFGVNTGTGTGLKVKVLTHSGNYGALGNVSIEDAGSGYAVGDTIKFNHTFNNGIMNLYTGNTQTPNSTRASVAGNTYNVTVTNAMTSGNGSGLYIEFTVNTDGSVSMDIAGTPNDWTKIGTNFVDNEDITIPDSLLGNTGAADITTSVAGIIGSGFHASRTVTSISNTPPPPPNNIPTRSSVSGLDYKYFLVLPTAHVNAKDNIDGGSLDYGEYMSLPHYTIA
tara:strand:+ start:7628 stop:8959 length:1332 start_codon:yes stop_codon:yes gene_type:complete